MVEQPPCPAAEVMARRQKHAALSGTVHIPKEGQHADCRTKLSSNLSS